MKSVSHKGGRCPVNMYEKETDLSKRMELDEMDQVRIRRKYGLKSVMKEGTVGTSRSHNRLRPPGQL